MRKVTLTSLLLLYLILSLSVAVPLLVWTTISLGELRANDLLVAISLSAGLLLFPMLYISGAWWVLHAVERTGGSPSRGRTMLAAYSGAVVVLWVCLRTLGRGLEVGSSTGWLVTLSSIAGYSSLFVLPIALVTGLAALGGAVWSKAKRGQASA